MNKFVLFFLCIGLFYNPCQVMGIEKSDDLAYEAFQSGQVAYKQGDFQSAVNAFEQACEQAILFVDAYYIWLGAACEQAFKNLPAPQQADHLKLLKKGISAYQTAFKRNRDPAIRYDLGRLMTIYGLENARTLLKQEIVQVSSTPLETQASGADSTQKMPNPSKKINKDIAQYWQMTADGLHEIWEAIIAQEHKELLASPQRTSYSDSIQTYLSVYIEHTMDFIETASEVNFKNTPPNFYIPKIEAACRRGQNGANAKWFTSVYHAIRFDGGRNMPSAIYRLKALRLSKNEQYDQAVNTFQKAHIYAKSDTSKASLYLDMAFTAYHQDLAQAVDFARQAYLQNPNEQRIRDTYGGLTLSLFNKLYEQGQFNEAIVTVHPITTFSWQDRGEALIGLARAYLESDDEYALDKAYEVAGEAYRLDTDRYWKAFHNIAHLHGSFAQAMELENKHQQHSNRQ